MALVAVDIAGLSYGEAARVLGAPEATITTRCTALARGWRANSIPTVRAWSGVGQTGLEIANDRAEQT